MKKDLLRKRLAAGLVGCMALSTLMLTGCGNSSTSVVADDVAALEEAADEAYAREMTETLAYDEALNDEDTLYRGAGSASEIATAEYLAAEFEKIGLEDVTLDEVTVDGWATG